MAITAATRKSIIDMVVGAYNAAPGTTLLASLVAESEAGKSLADIAVILTTSDTFNKTYPTFQTAAEFGAEFLANILPGVPADALAEGVTIVEGLLAAGGTRADVVRISVEFLAALDEADPAIGTYAKGFNNKAEVATYYTLTLEQADSSTSAIAAVTSDDATVQTAKDAVGGGAASGGQTYALTTGQDTVVGTAGGDAINAGAGALTVGDTIAGGEGVDTLNATINGTAPAQSATSMTGVEILNLTASPNPASIALTGVTGVTDINNVDSASGATLTVSGVGAPVSSTISGATTTTIGYTAAVTGKTAVTDAATLTLAGVTAGSSYTANGVDQLTIASTKSANTLTTLGSSAAATVTITGDQDLTTGSIGGSKLTALDASGFTGSALTVQAGAGAGGATKAGVLITAPTAAATTSTITAGGNKDTITLGAGTNTLIAGGGDDTITSGAGTNTITGGSGNDKITLSGGKDTLVYAEAGGTDSDTIDGFTASTVFSLTLGKDAVAGKSTAIPNADFGVRQTGATKVSIGNVDGKGTGTAIAFETVNANEATAGSVKATSNVIALNSAFTDGTATGAVNALGTTATTGIETTAGSKFLLVTYSVGNIAQIWSYNGDTTANTDIDVAELDLLATLNGVTQGSLTAANFATFVTPDVVTTTPTPTGQTITVVGALNNITSVANANGQFLTAAADTINVQIGSLPTAAASATTGLTIFDATIGDSDVFNATVLNDAWQGGVTMSNVETVNLTLAAADTGWTAATTMPGTTTVNFAGTQDQTGLVLSTGMTVGLSAGYKNSVTNTPALAALSLNLDGTAGATPAASPQFVSTGAITALTVNVNGTNTFRGDGTKVFNATNTTLKGSGALSIFDTAAAIGSANIAGNDVTRTGGFTLIPTTDAAMDLSDASKVTGVDAINLSAISSYSSTITLATDNSPTNEATSIIFGSATATASGAFTVAQAGSGLNDAVNVSLSSKITTAGAIAAATIETLNVTSSLASTGTLSLGNITLTNGVGTQTVKLTTGATVGGTPTITADTVDFSGVTGSVTNLTLANTGGVAFTGGSKATTVTGTAAADVINTGAGNDVVADGGTAGDSISTGDGNDVIAAAGAAIDTSMNGGAGNDSYHFAAVPTGGNTSVITDSAGTDTLVFANAAAADITAMNSGNDLGVERLVVNDVTSGLTVAPGQIGTLSITGSAVGGALDVTLGTAGALNMSAVTFTALAASAFLTNTGAASALTNAVTSTTLNGTAGDDTITGSSLVDVIAGGDGTDTVSGGAGVDVFQFANGDHAGADGAAVADIITGFVVGTDNIQFTTGTDVVSVQQAAVAAAVTALAAGSTDAQIATAMANANTTNLGVSYALFNGNAYAYYEKTGATTTHVEADNNFIKLAGVTTLPTFAADNV